MLSLPPLLLLSLFLPLSGRVGKWTEYIQEFKKASREKPKAANKCFYINNKTNDYVIEMKLRPVMKPERIIIQL